MPALTRAEWLHHLFVDPSTTNVRETFQLPRTPSGALDTSPAALVALGERLRQAGSSIEELTRWTSKRRSISASTWLPAVGLQPEPCTQQEADAERARHALCRQGGTPCDTCAWTTRIQTHMQDVIIEFPEAFEDLDRECRRVDENTMRNRGYQTLPHLNAINLMHRSKGVLPYTEHDGGFIPKKPSPNRRGRNVWFDDGLVLPDEAERDDDWDVVMT